MEGKLSFTEASSSATLDDVARLTAALSLYHHLQNEAQKRAQAAP